MKYAGIILLVCLSSCRSPCSDAQTVTFLANVQEVVTESDAYTVKDTALTEDQAKERLMRNELIRQRIAMVLATEVQK